jgi:hypothetical protein
VAYVCTCGRALEEDAFVKGPDADLFVLSVQIDLNRPTYDGGDLGEGAVFGTFDQAVEDAVQEGIGVALDPMAQLLGLA